MENVFAENGVLFSSGNQEENVHRLQLECKSVTIIGTAHVSARSAELVKGIIACEKPDAVCVELCGSRYRSILRHGLSTEINVGSVLGLDRKVLLPALMLWYFQNKLGKQLGTDPGRDMLAAIEAARIVGSRIYPIDRDFRITLARAWQVIRLRGKLAFVAELLSSVWSFNRIKEEDIEALKNEQGIEKLIMEFDKSFPGLRQVFIDERDQHMADEIRAIDGNRMVAVVGAAHVPGILQKLKSIRVS